MVKFFSFILNVLYIQECINNSSNIEKDIIVFVFVNITIYPQIYCIYPQIYCIYCIYPQITELMYLYIIFLTQNHKRLNWLIIISQNVIFSIL